MKVALLLTLKTPQILIQYAIYPNDFPKFGLGCFHRYQEKCRKLDVVSDSDNKGDHNKNDKEDFLLAGYSKDFEIWGFLLRIDAKLSST